MNLVIEYFYIILLYEIESQLYAMKFAQVKKFFLNIFFFFGLRACLHTSLRWPGYIPVFLFGLIDCLLWSWCLGEWVVNTFKGLICLKMCHCFCFVGYFLDTPSLWTSMLDKFQCWHWGEGGKAVTLGSRHQICCGTGLCHSESFLEQKNFILPENVRIVAQDDVYVLQYF